jgi:hypothetical protein
MQRPQRVISENEKFRRDINEILNKISPDTLDKLTGRLCSLEVNSKDHLDCMVQFIHEKAMLEQKFSAMYASMCQRIDNEAQISNVVFVLRFEDLGQYSWATGLEVDDDVFGPYSSSSECLDALKAESLGFQCDVKRSIKVHDFVVYEERVLKVYVDPESGEFYGNVDYKLPEFPVSGKTEERMMYSTSEAAMADGKKKSGFLAQITMRCKDEFYASTSIQPHSDYGKYMQAKTELDEIEATLSVDEREMRRSELEEWRSKLKRRKLGNITFIGELCKQGITKKQIINHCTKALLEEDDVQNPVTGKMEFAGWKAVDEETIDALCQLLKIVGAELDRDTTKKHVEQMKKNYSRLATIAADKTMSSRIRFSIEEILVLRSNNWVDRRAQEGPLKIDQVHQKAKEEALRRPGLVTGHTPVKQAPSQTSRGPGYPPRGGSSDARSLQTNISIMPRQQQQRDQKAGSSTSSPSVAHKSIVVNPAGSSSGQRSRSGSEIEQDGMSFGQRSRAGSDMEPQDAPERSAAEITKSVQSFVDEFCTLGDIEEVKICLEQQHSKIAYKMLIPQIISKFLQMPKETVRESLLGLIDSLVEPLTGCSQEILEALVEYEDIKLLPDFIVDCKQAPQFVGSILGRLVKNSICNLNAIESALSKITAASIAEGIEFGASEDVIRSVFDQVTVSITENST